MHSNGFKYQEFKELLLGKIQSGIMGSGEKLPPEPSLAKEHGISRNTVRQAIKELETEGYIQRTRGRGTFLRATKPVSARRIGLVVFDIAYTTHPLTAALIRGVGEVLEEKGFLLDIMASERQRISETFLPRVMDYAAFLIAAYQVDQQMINLLQNKRIPHLFVKNYPEACGSNRYYLDYRAVGWQAVEFLAGLGHVRLALFGFDETYPSSRDFFDGAKSACLEFGCRLKQDHCRVVGLEGEGIEEALESILRIPEESPTAIITLEDIVAARTIRLLEERGVLVPEGISVTGCNDLEISRFMTPTITTFELPARKLGMDAAVRLIEQLTAPSSSWEEKRYAPKLIARESSGVPANNPYLFATRKTKTYAH